MLVGPLIVLTKVPKSQLLYRAVVAPKIPKKTHTHTINSHGSFSFSFYSIIPLSTNTAYKELQLH